MNNNDQARLSQNQYIGLKKELFPKKKKGSSYLAYDTEELYIYNHLDRPVLVAGANIEGDLASPRVFLPASELSIDYMNVINESQVSEWNSSLANPKKDTIVFYTGNDDSSSVIKQVFHVDINGDVTPIYERKENSNYNRILSGHVEWSGSGLNFESTNITYIFNNEELICQSEAFELNISNSGDRIDVIAVNNEGDLVIIEGTPSQNPQEPTINFETELRVTAIYLNEGESTPSGMYDDIIYDENLGSPNEWDEISSIPQNNIDLNSSDSPYSGVKHISAQNLISGNEFNFRKNSLVNLEGLSSFSFRINSLGEKNKPIYIKLLNNGNGFHAFEIQPGTYGLSVISSQDYELITVPYSVFNPSNEPFNEVSIAFSQNSGDSISQVYLDKIRLVYGMENPVLSNTFLNLTDTPNSYNSFGEYDVVVKKDESGLEFIKRRTNLSEFNNDEGFITEDDLEEITYSNGINNIDDESNVELGGSISKDTELAVLDGNSLIFSVPNEEQAVNLNKGAINGSHISYGDIRIQPNENLYIKCKIQLVGLQAINSHVRVLSRHDGNNGFVLEMYNDSWIFGFNNNTITVHFTTSIPNPEKIYELELLYNGSGSIEYIKVNGIDSGLELNNWVGESLIDYDGAGFSSEELSNLTTNIYEGIRDGQFRIYDMEFYSGELKREFKIQEGSGYVLNDDYGNNAEIISNNLSWYNGETVNAPLIRLDDNGAKLYSSLDFIKLASGYSLVNKNFIEHEIRNTYSPTSLKRYEDIPLEAGLYLIETTNWNDNYDLELDTNVFSYEDGSSITSGKYIGSGYPTTGALPIGSGYTVIERRETVATGIITSPSIIPQNKLIDYVYQQNGQLSGIINVESGSILEVEESLFIQNRIPNTYIALKNSHNLSLPILFHGYIEIELKEDMYEDGLITLPFVLPHEFEVIESELFYESIKLSNYKIGLVSGASDKKIGIQDLSGTIENLNYGGTIKLFVKYRNIGNSERVTNNKVNSRINVVNLESGDTVHSSAMTTTFDEAYGGFSNTVFNANYSDIGKFSSQTTRDQHIIDNNVDLMFSASSGIGPLKVFKQLESFGIVPLGSNDLIRQDNTSAIDVFPNNYIAVTSRSETDNDGTDPLGTSYGFGVEFNEPTLSADLIGQGLTGWPGDNEHQQSPATAIVAGKMKYIKDQTGASWDIIREACRQTASNANNYNIYRGFGVIDTAAAIALISTLEDARSLELAEYYEATTAMPLALKYENKSLNTLVNKRDLENNFVKKSLNIEKTTVSDVFNISNTANGTLTYQVKDNLVSIVCQFDGLSSGVLECLVLPEEIRPAIKRYSSIYNSSNINAYKLEINTNGSVVGQFNSGRTMYFDFTYDLSLD